MYALHLNTTAKTMHHVMQWICRQSTSPPKPNTMKVEDLEAHLTQAFVDRSPLNLLPELIACAKTHDARTLHKALFALYRVFTVALGSRYYAPSATSAVSEVRRWLEQHVEEYVNTLISLLDHSSVDIRASLFLSCTFVKC